MFLFNISLYIEESAKCSRNPMMLLIDKGGLDLNVTVHVLLDPFEIFGKSFPEKT